MKFKNNKKETKLYIDSCGVQFWCQYDEYHRINGPAVIEIIYQSWIQNGKYHRQNGPAVIWIDGTEYWFQNGLRHRINGPAVIHPDGSNEWYENGKCIDRKY